MDWEKKYKKYKSKYKILKKISGSGKNDKYICNNKDGSCGIIKIEEHSNIITNAYESLIDCESDCRTYSVTQQIIYPEKHFGNNNDFSKFKDNYELKSQTLRYLARSIYNLDGSLSHNESKYYNIFLSLLELYEIKNFCIYSFLNGYYNGSQYNLNPVEAFNIQMINFNKIYEYKENINEKLSDDNYNCCIFHDNKHECDLSDKIFCFLLCPTHIIPIYVNKTYNQICIIDPTLLNTCFKNDTDRVYDIAIKYFKNKIGITDGNKFTFVEELEKFKNLKIFNPNKFFVDKPSNLSFLQHGTRSGTCQTWSIFINLYLALNYNIPVRTLITKLLHYGKNTTSNLNYILFYAYNTIIASENTNELIHDPKDLLSKNDANFLDSYVNRQTEHINSLIKNEKGKEKSDVKKIKFYYNYKKILNNILLLQNNLYMITYCMTNIIKDFSYIRGFINELIILAIKLRLGYSKNIQYVNKFSDIGRIEDIINNMFMNSIFRKNVVLYKKLSNVFIQYKKKYNIMNHENFYRVLCKMELKPSNKEKDAIYKNYNDVICFLQYILKISEITKETKYLFSEIYNIDQYGIYINGLIDSYPKI